MTTAKRQTIVDFLKHSICEGQSEIGPIGYSPLPINLVQAGFTQVNKLKLADDDVEFDASIIQDVKDCHNPTFVAGQAERELPRQDRAVPGRLRPPGQGSVRRGRGRVQRQPRRATARSRPTRAATGNGGGDGGTGGTAAPTARGPTAPTDGDGVPDAPAAGADPGLAGDLGLGGDDGDGRRRRARRSWPRRCAADGCRRTADGADRAGGRPVPRRAGGADAWSARPSRDGEAAR